MSRRSGTSVAVAILVVAAALIGNAVRADATLAPPKQTPCGDIVGGRWMVSDYESGTRLTGTHYTVVAVNFPCTRARSFVTRLTHRRSLGPGPTALLPGFMCITGIPKGWQLQHGGCSLGSTPVLMPTAGVKSFKWQACVAIGHQHPTCTTRRP